MHWRNSNFQIRNFLANKCHTVDEAYRMLQELREERDVAIMNAEASKYKTQADILEANNTLDNENSSEVDKLRAKAKLAEVDSFKQQSQECYDEGVRERDYIDSLIEQLQPHRKFSNLPDHEAHQAAQQEEWRLELLFRAENFLACGGIPSDHMATMRLHPQWQDSILPRIEHMATSAREGRMSLITKSEVVKFLEKLPETENIETVEIVEEVGSEVASAKTN